MNYPGILFLRATLKSLGRKASVFYYDQTDTYPPRPGYIFALCANNDPGLKRNEELDIANPCLSYLWLLSVNVLCTYYITTDMLLVPVDTNYLQAIILNED